MGLGLQDPRSALWFEMLRVVTELRPDICLIENVDKLKTKGLTTVLHGLDSIGYAAEWDIIPAAAVGAPHLRQRIWIVARPRELALDEVYGDGIDKTFTLLDKMPRAGRMTDGVVEELEPIAPKKTKRKDGWSYWTGVRLFGGEDEVNLRWATPSATMADRGGRGDLIQQIRGNPSPSGHFATNGMWPTPDATEGTRGPHGDHAAVDGHHHTGTKAQRTLTAAAAAAVDRGSLCDPQRLEIEYALLPTPTPTSHLNGNSPENHMQKKAERCGGERGSITDLNVLAANDFIQVSGMMWPTATARDWKDVGDLSVVDDNSLLPRVVDSVDRGVRLMPTPTPTPTTADGGGGPGCSGREGGDNLRTFVTQDRLLPTPTPTAADSRNGRNATANRSAENDNHHSGTTLSDVVYAPEQRGSLSATWVEWLMGAPLWWTSLDVPNDFCTLVGWEHEPLDVVSRLSVGERDRAKRLKALGNAVVHQCAAYALKRALEATPGFGR